MSVYARKKSTGIGVLIHKVVGASKPHTQKRKEKRKLVVSHDTAFRLSYTPSGVAGGTTQQIFSPPFVFYVVYLCVEAVSKLGSFQYVNFTFLLSSSAVCGRLESSRSLPTTQIRRRFNKYIKFFFLLLRCLISLLIFFSFSLSIVEFSYPPRHRYLFKTVDFSFSFYLCLYLFERHLFFFLFHLLRASQKRKRKKKNKALRGVEYTYFLFFSSLCVYASVSVVAPHFFSFFLILHFFFIFFFLSFFFVFCSASCAFRAEQDKAQYFLFIFLSFSPVVPAFFFLPHHFLFFLNFCFSLSSETNALSFFFVCTSCIVFVSSHQGCLSAPPFTGSALPYVTPRPPCHRSTV